MTVPALMPALVLGVVASTMFAAVAHLIRGQTLRDLLSLWLVTQVGFWLAALLAAVLRAPLYSIGELQLVSGLAGGMLALTLAIVTRKRV